jgi:SAM-dependent methyltransferase
MINLQQSGGKRSGLWHEQPVLDEPEPPFALAGRLQARIRRGQYTPEGLARAFARRSDGREGFDSLDLLVAALLNDGPPDEERARLEPEMVRYQPTPARVILEMLALTRLGPDDVLYDLGSGLGHVVMLAALLTGARAIGVEREPSYCEYAKRRVRALGLRGVDFVQGDAREAPLDGGTVYFLFTPFRGAMLRQVVARLPRGVRICTHGPCTDELGGLQRVAAGREVALFVKG